MGMISKCCQALEAAPAAPATLETLRELQKLHPSLFVPLDCPRRAELKKRVKAVAARSKVKLSYTKFTESIRSMPTPTMDGKCGIINLGVLHVQCTGHVR
jgi:hypothetical protein